jgi:hypothetical protein
LSICPVILSAGPEICRAGGQVAVVGIECVVDFLLYGAVDAIDLLPALPELEAGLEDLNPHVVFFVYHGCEGFARCNYHASRALAAGMLTADQVPFDKQVLLQSRGCVNIDEEYRLPEIQGQQGVFEFVQHLPLPPGRETRQEFIAGQVSSQANARRYDDFGARPGAVEPFADVIAEVHGYHCRFSIMSRSLAAVS